MNTRILSTLLYPYPYQYEAITMTMISLGILSLMLFGIYKTITWKMGKKLKEVFKGLIIIAGISLVVLFMAGITVSLVTIRQVNKQLGFGYATPDTLEGEIFEIQRVTSGKTMDKSGLRVGDQVMMNNVNHLYRLLIDNQGKEVVINILREHERIEIIIKVPSMRVPLARISFLF